MSEPRDASGVNAPRVTVIGECVIEVTASGIESQPGGDAACMAMAAASTGGADVYLATAVGDDALSDQAVAALDASGVRTTFIQRLPGELPALAVDTVDGNTGRLVWRAGTAIRRMFPVHTGYLRELGASELIAFSAASIAVLPEGGRKTLLQLARNVRSAGKRVALLLGTHPTLWSESESRRELDRYLGACSTLFTHRRDLETLFGALAGDAAIDALHARGVTEVVVWDRTGATLASTGPHRVARHCEIAVPGTRLAGRYLAARIAGAEVEAALERALSPDIPPATSS